MKNKGFTLIELLAVIVILAIILAIAVPMISGMISISKKQAFQSDAKMLLNSIRIKMLEDSAFNPEMINETNVVNELKLSNVNYKKLSVTLQNGKPNIVLTGQNQWANYIAFGDVNDLTIDEGLIVWLDAGNTQSYSGIGNTWVDLSGNSNSASKNGNVNNPVWNPGGYWYFPATSIGINGGMQIPNSVSLSSASAMTIEMVFTLETKTLVTGDSDWMCLFSKGITGNSDQTPAISIHQLGSSSYRYLHIEKPASYNSAANVFTDYTGNVWYHVTAVLGATSYGYLNGTQVSSSAGGIVANNYPIYLGVDSDNEMFKGKLAIVKVYNRALSASEVQNNFNKIRSRFSL